MTVLRRCLEPLKPLRVLTAIAITLAGCAESPQQQLMSAVLRGDIAKVESLLNDPHVDVNWKGPRSGTNALTSASAHDKVAIVRLLLQRGADPNISTDENYTPLQSAAYHGHTQIVKLLIDAGADVNAAETRHGFTALADAASHGHVDAIRLLLDAGADRRIRIKDGRTPQQLAEHYGHLNAVNVLIFHRPRTSAQAAPVATK